MVTGTDILVRTQPRIADIPHRALALSVLISILVLISCGGGGGAQNSSGDPVTYTIGGTISGLSGSDLVLQDNGGNDLTVGAGATSFTFTTPIATGGAYSVTVMSQPSNPSQTCTVTSGSGTVASGNVSNVVVTCVPDYTIGGTIAGLSGSGLVLLVNGGNEFSVSAPAGTAGTISFRFHTEIANAGAYSVTVMTQPSNPSQTCTVSNGSGTVTGANVTNVAITCLPLPQGFAGFVPTGSMTAGRISHTATLLNNGKVLITGGAININTLTFITDSAELYDPATGTFTGAGRMTTVREGSTATLLNNGQVLIVGGDNGDCDSSNCVLASAELYNPSTGTFTATGNMTDTRTEHTATLLNNGKVLMAGGFNGDMADLASAELYDPATGTFTPTGSMTTARQNQTAALLNNGMVLIAGGTEGGSPILATAELYDPTTGIFSSTGSMAGGRVGHTATLLNNGQVLIVGGGNPSGELFNPATGVFTITGDTSANLSGATATLLNNGQVLIAGGDEGPGSNVPMASALLYNPATGAFTSAGIMTTARAGDTATLLNNGNVLVAGGVASPSYFPILASAELFLPGTMTPTGLVSITVTPANPTLSVGSTQQFVATGTFSDSSTQTLQSVTWSSSNQAAATITNDASDHGVALALAAGQSTITATAGSVSGSTDLTVQ